MTRKYCDVALPVPLRSAFTYAIPDALASNDLIGHRVLVPFRNKPAVGVVLAITDKPPQVKRVFEVSELLDPIPALSPKMLELGQWISRYYVAPIGESLRAMLPPETKLRFDREYWITEAGRGYLAELSNGGELTDVEKKERAFLKIFAKSDDSENVVPSARVRRAEGGEAAAEALTRLGYLAAREVAKSRTTRTQKIVAWNDETPASQLGDAENRVREILTTERGPLTAAMLLVQAKITRAVLARMEKSGLVRSWDEPILPGEDSWDTDFTAPNNELNAEQKHALAEIWRWIVAGKFEAALLHGVTGSGKTEVYLGAIDAALSRGRTAIVLVPEIALTLWLGRLVRARFGDTVAVLHSGLPDVERAREWWRVRRGDARVVVGTRSAIFAPLENLGLIIVDEEHETSYKQEETPRYNGRDTAVYRAHLENAVIVLGSATPSLESYHNARNGKYKLLELKSRVANRPLAEVRVVDLREEFRRAHKSAPVSESLRSAIALRLEEKTQAMVLINRRGYSWSCLCRSCGVFVQCENCSIALTYHKNRHKLECHYCGFTANPPKRCPKCDGEYMYFVGDGAERVEEYLAVQFTSARIARLDRDTVRTKSEYQQVLGAFAKGGDRRSGRHPDGRQGSRLPARYAGWRGRSRSRFRTSRLSRRRKILPASNPGGRPCRPRRSVRRSARRNLLSRALRYPIRRETGLRTLLRERVALPPHAPLSAICCARERADPRQEN